jgi:hypothetical protein
MALDPDDFFDEETMTALRALRRDRKLTIGGGARSWGVPAEDTGVELAHFVAYMDLENKDVLSGSAALADERDEALVAMLLQAILQPDRPARPRLPRRVIVEEQTIAQTIERPLRRLGVETTVAPVRALDGLVEAMRAAIASFPAWFRDTAAGLPLYQAAAALWAAAPWDALPDENTSATIEVRGPTSRTLHAIAAEIDELAAVMFLLSGADFERMVERAATTEEGDPGTVIVPPQHDPITSYDMLMVLYADAEEDEIEHVSDKRLPIGSGSAYPRLLRCGDGDEARQINDDEARLLVLAMDGLARFCLSQSRPLASGDTPVQDDVLVRDGDELVVVSVRTPAEPR